MSQFVLIFRQGTQQLGEAELRRRGEEVRVWAAEHNAAGHALEPRMPGDSGVVIGPDGAERPLGAPAPGTVIALLFFTAADFTDATRVARSHPGLRYGSEVELRPWTAPAPPPHEAGERR